MSNYGAIAYYIAAASANLCYTIVFGCRFNVLLSPVWRLSQKNVHLDNIHELNMMTEYAGRQRASTSELCYDLGVVYAHTRISCINETVELVTDILHEFYQVDSVQMKHNK